MILSGKLVILSSLLPYLMQSIPTQVEILSQYVQSVLYQRRVFGCHNLMYMRKNYLSVQLGAMLRAE